VLVAGGLLYNGDVTASGDLAPLHLNGGIATSSAELFDASITTDGSMAVAGAWHATAPLPTVRVQDTSALLPTGEVLVAGGDALSPDGKWGPSAAATVYDPSTGEWTDTDSMTTPRINAVATVLGGPFCRGKAPVSYCGSVLVSGGCHCEIDNFNPFDLASAELYSAPSVSRLTPGQGPNSGNTAVAITGRGFAQAREVHFGDAVISCPSATCSIDSPTQLTVTAPPHPDGMAGVVVVANNRASPDRLVDRSASYLYVSCGARVSAGQVSYPSGYSLVGMPAGTTIPAQSYLYSWFDQGGGGSYRADDPLPTTTAGGHGYWAWFSCARPVTPSGPGTAAMTLPLAAGHASMVGNPSGTKPVTASGQDFAARWDPSLNGGAGGYVISGYRQAQPLAIGEGVWVFAFSATLIGLG
jgi:hypothetical protein